jgi:glycosyltransferase involved in cell wall biosynthesis
MTSPPRISVVIPAFNAERFIAEAIESAVGQTLKPSQIVVIDNASEDGTGEVASRYPEVTLERIEPNRGPAGARNAGFRIATGELISFHDADDVMLPEKLAIQVRHLREHPETGVVLGCQEIVVEEGAEVPFWHRDTSTPVLMPPPETTEDMTQVHPMTILVRREVFEQVGPFDEEIGPAEDVDWLLRAKEAGAEIARLENVLVRRRIHSAGLTQDAAAARMAIFRAFKAKIERSRRTQR